MNGAISGPMMIMPANSATASPRYWLLYMSAKTAATSVSGAEPNKPTIVNRLATAQNPYERAFERAALTCEKSAYYEGLVVLRHGLEVEKSGQYQHLRQQPLLFHLPLRC